MSKYSKRAKRGNRVKQGQVIGYVGKSGLATGPHLHYEFRVSGKHRDPLRVKLPKSLVAAEIGDRRVSQDDGAAAGPAGGDSGRDHGRQRRGHRETR